MSMTGSLMGYENNNEVNQAKCRKPLKPLPIVSSVNSSGIHAIGKSKRPRRPAGRDSCIRGRVNNLWSVWYGVLAVAFQAYIGLRYAKRFAAYLSLPWPADAPPPKLELYACLVLAGTGVVLLPVLLAAAFLKLGNLANDGAKLGRNLTACSRDPPSSLLASNPEHGLANNLWRHGGPTAAFVHLCTAMCFLLPSLLMEARLIHAGFLPKDAIWRTDLDWLVTHRERLLASSFADPTANLTVPTTGFATPRPFLASTTASTTAVPDEAPRSPSIDPTRSTRAESTATTSVAPRPTSAFSGRANATTSGAPSATSPVPPTRGTGTPTPAGPPSTSVALAASSGSSAGRRNGSDVGRPGSGKPVAGSPGGRGKQRTRSGGNSSATARPGGPVSGGNATARSMSLTLNSLADLDQPDKLNPEQETGKGGSRSRYPPARIPLPAESSGPVTLEYLNYAVALGVYSVRYPAVFWSCNKALGTIFSFQLILNSCQSLLGYVGMSVLYKVQVIGPLKVLPVLRQRYRAPSSGPATATGIGVSSLLGDSHFLLNPRVTLALFGLSSLLVLCSSMVVYLYAYGRFTAFLNQERERRVILAKGHRKGNGWAYFVHCTALCVLLAIAICSAPLLYDYSVVYRGSMDGAILACIVATVLHLLLWLLLWIGLTIKRRWTFELRVTIGRATVRSARSVKLVTDVDLLSARDEEDGSGAPLLVVGNGRTYTIADASPKKAIMSVIQRAAIERKARCSQGGNADSVDGEPSADDEQIYWLRPKLRPSPGSGSPSDGPTGPGGPVGSTGPPPPTDKGWLNKKLKPKVTFNDLPSTSGSRPKGKARRGGGGGGGDGGPEDDGDYATLRELPLITSLDPADDSASEENKLLECVNDDRVTYYASANRDLQPSEGDPSPLLTPDPAPDPLPLPPPTPTRGPITDPPAAAQPSVGQTPRCLRRADSGMPHEELTPRSDTSTSPPLDAATGHSNASSSHSETSSSGVHSTGSTGSCQRRTSSTDDVAGTEGAECRGCSGRPRPLPPAQSFSSPRYANHAPLFVEPGGGGGGGGGGTASSSAPVDGNDSSDAACPGLGLDEPSEATVVIRRKVSRAKLTEPVNPNEEPFGRSTNMRMTSFTESNEVRVHAASATLPHYPTQPVISFPHCSTMPLPHVSHGMPGSRMAGSSGSCGSVPRHAFVPPQVHTTLPSHQNGLRLVPGPSPAPSNPFVKRFPAVQLHAAQPWALPGHHTFPQPAQLNGKPSGPAQIRQTDRDSANFSMASSGDSDTGLPR